MVSIDAPRIVCLHTYPHKQPVNNFFLKEDSLNVNRASYKGRGGGPGIPPPKKSWILSMVIILVPSILAIHIFTCYWTYVCVIKMLFGKFVPDCVRSNLNSKFSLGVGGRGRGMPPDPPSRHARLYTQSFMKPWLHKVNHCLGHILTNTRPPS